ncbi:MAG: FAD-dependent thymidylate synthase [Candidatus Anstonellales archaeon]
MSEFSEEEKKIIAKYFTNLDKNIFGVVNLPEVVKGTLFARYSRSEKSLRRTLLDEFIKKEGMGFGEIIGERKEDEKSAIATEKAEKFYERVLIGFGDDSVGELAGVHIAVENVSNVATKLIEDRRIGLSPLEKSSRYVYFDKRDEKGRYMYYREPTIMESGFDDAYEETLDFLFDTYAELIPRVSEYVRKKYPKGEESERAYEAATRAKTCDLLRGLLPAATLTNLGLFGNGRAFEYLLATLYASRLREAQKIAEEMEEELKKIIPSFVKRANDEKGKEMQEYIKNRKNAANLAPQKISYEKSDDVRLVGWDEDGVEKVVCAILFPYSQTTYDELMEKVRRMNDEEKERIINAYVGERKNRRHKPGRAFENAYYTFEIVTNFGAFRDLHRHRILTQERQLLTANLGYDMPKELKEAGVSEKFEKAMDEAKKTYQKIAERFREEAQYCVPFAYRIRFYMTMNAREVYHLTELRTGMQGHPDYRHVAQKIYSLVKERHPLIFKHAKFVDMKEYGLERIEAEKRLDKKIENLKT